MSEYPHSNGTPDHETALKTAGVTDVEAFNLGGAWYRYEEHLEEHVFVAQLDVAARETHGPLSAFDIWDAYQKGSLETAEEIVINSYDDSTDNEVSVCPPETGDLVRLEIDSVSEQASPAIDFYKEQSRIIVHSNTRVEPKIVIALPTDQSELSVDNTATGRSS